MYIFGLYVHHSPMSVHLLCSNDRESQQSSMEIRRALSGDLGGGDILQNPRQDDLLKFRSVPIASSSVRSTMDSHGTDNDQVLEPPLQEVS